MGAALVLCCFAALLLGAAAAAAATKRLVAQGSAMVHIYLHCFFFGFHKSVITIGKTTRQNVQEFCAPSLLAKGFLRCLCMSIRKYFQRSSESLIGIHATPLMPNFPSPNVCLVLQHARRMK